MTTVDLRVVPRSAPDPMPWPLRPARSPVDLSQPPLPWTDGPAPVASQPSPVEPAGHQVRTVRFGDNTVELAPGLPDPGPWCVRLAGTVLETLQGLRPIGQLSRWVHPAILAELTLRARRRAGPGQPRLRAVHLHQLGAATIEAVAVYAAPSGRSSALAFRLEGLGDRWICTALQGEPRAER